MYIIYNCSEAGGCSRKHKHMQGLLGPPTAFRSVTETNKSKSSVPFQTFTHHFEQGFANTPVTDVFNVYGKLLGRAKEALDISEENTVCPHNVVLWSDWMIVIPRRTGAIGTASANSAGMLGSVWVHEEALVDEWRRLGCRHVLEELGVPP